MATVTIKQAKAKLSNLIARAEAGEEIIIARGATPIVRLRPIARRRPSFGALKGKLSLPDEFFFDPLDEAELRAWEGVDKEPR